MHVLATAGHVDHGKSALLRALTGQEPDRYAEEQRRGLTLDLGFVWTGLDGETLAFVDVPGHERFVPTMLAGVGPVPAVVLVVAADGGWMPQTTEHVEALHALQVRHALVVVSRADLADPAPVAADVRDRLARTSLAGAEVVAASARTGAGLDDVRSALLRLVRSLPAPDVDAAVRLWVDRSFTIRGAGTVVTGTLPAGTLRVGDRLVLPDGTESTVRGLHSLDEPRRAVPAVARVAVNLRGVDRERVQRGDALVAPDAFVTTAQVDVRCSTAVDQPPASALLHLGSAQVEARVRPLDDRHWRLRLHRPLPLHVGDVGLLRDPGRRAVLTGVTVLDVLPPALDRRGAAARRAAVLAAAGPAPDGREEVARRGVVSRRQLVAMGVPPTQGGQWLVDPDRARELADRLQHLVKQHDAEHPLDRGLPLEAARASLALPAADVVRLVVRAPLTVRAGRVVLADDEPGRLPEPVAAAVRLLVDELTVQPEVVRPAEPGRLAELGLDRRAVAAAVRAGALVDLGGVLVAPAAVVAAVHRLAGLAEPFTVADARDAWGTSRKVAVPLLERLDRDGVTRRRDDGTRVLSPSGPPRGRLGT